MKYNRRSKTAVTDKPPVLKECMFCAYIPEILYQPGATSVKCNCKQTALPDYNVELAIALWNDQWHSQGVISYTTNP